MFRLPNSIARGQAALVGALFGLLASHTWLPAAAALRITSLDAQGGLTWTNAPVPGVCTIETGATPAGPWWPGQNVFATAAAGQASVPAGEGNRFHRLSAVDVSATGAGFTNLIGAYGLLETIAGTGWDRRDNLSFWQESFEGGPGTAAALSRPHIALTDRAGNVFIADKNSHAVLRLAPDGTLHTFAGTHTGGLNGDGPAPATELQLKTPNGLWVRADGTVYILDTGNTRVRRVATNGVMTTLFAANNCERGFWIKDDESLAYFGAKTKLQKWTPSGVTTLASGFSELGLFIVEPSGNLVVCDRGAHYVYRVTTAGLRTVLAGNGTTSGGGDGLPALQTGLNGPRGIWPLPTGGYLLLLHDGAQLWYLDTAGILHRLINGLGGNVFVHGGDGEYFYSPEQANIGEGRSVALDHAGNIILVESDYGFVRRIRFARFTGGSN